VKDSSVAIETALAFISLRLPLSAVIAATKEKYAYIVAVPVVSTPL
jgi:hypothetical protein